MTSLAESEEARRARHFCALERRLFETLGGWVPSVAEAEVKLLLRVHSFRHAWHAELWAGLLPVGEDEASATLARPISSLLDGLAQVAGTAQRLTAAYRVVLPRLTETYTAVRDGLSEPSGGPAARVLRLVLEDDLEACRAGTVLLERTLAALPDTRRSDGEIGRLEAALAAAGGLGSSRAP